MTVDDVLTEWQAAARLLATIAALQEERAKLAAEVERLRAEVDRLTPDPEPII